MKYYKYQDEWAEIEGAITYVETENGGELRRITYNGTKYLASNVIQPEGDMYLADTRMDYDEFSDEVTPITKHEFDEVWQAYLATRQTAWNLIKQTYPVGVTVYGSIHRFPPLRVIVTLGDNALGVANYSACKASIEPELMSSGDKITAVVTGYDKENQWVVLGSPQVYQERE